MPDYLFAPIGISGESGVKKYFNLLSTPPILLINIILLSFPVRNICFHLSILYVCTIQIVQYKDNSLRV